MLFCLTAIVVVLIFFKKFLAMKGISLYSPKDDSKMYLAWKVILRICLPRQFFDLRLWKLPGALYFPIWLALKCAFRILSVVWYILSWIFWLLPYVLGMITMFLLTIICTHGLFLDWVHHNRYHLLRRFGKYIVWINRYWGESYINNCLSQHRWEMLKVLIELGLHRIEVDSQGRNALHWVAWRSKRKHKILGWMIEGWKGDPRFPLFLNGITSEGRTPMHYAVDANNRKMIIALFELGADPMPIDSDEDLRYLAMQRELLTANAKTRYLMASLGYRIPWVTVRHQDPMPSLEDRVAIRNRIYFDPSLTQRLLRWL